MVKWSLLQAYVAQRVGRGIALLFLDRGTRRWWVVSSTPRPHFTPGKDPVPILQEAGWAPGPVWTGGKSHPHRDSIPDRPARSRRYTDWTTRPTRKRVDFHIQNSTPIFPFLSHVNPVYALLSHFPKVNLDITLHSKSNLSFTPYVPRGLRKSCSLLR